MELSDFFDGSRRWPQLRRLLSQLPWDSNFRRAVQDDEEFAEAYAASITEVPDGEDAAPELRSWDRWDDLKAYVADLVNSQTIALISTQIPKGKKRPKFRAAKRPKSAYAVAVDNRIRELESYLESEMLNQLGR